MLVIVKDGDWRLIQSPQTISAAWRKADRLTRETGIAHTVGRA